MLFGRFSGWSLGHSEGRKLTTSISFSSWQQRWTKRNMLSSCIIMYFLGGLPKTPVINERFFFPVERLQSFSFRIDPGSQHPMEHLWNPPPTVITRINSMFSGGIPINPSFVTVWVYRSYTLLLGISWKTTRINIVKIHRGFLETCFSKSFQCVHVCFNFGVSYPMTWIDLIEETQRSSRVWDVRKPCKS